MASKSGFTLMELVVAVALLLIVSAVALPLLGLRSGETRPALAGLELAITTAQQAAVNQRQPVRVLLDDQGELVMELLAAASASRELSAGRRVVGRVEGLRAATAGSAGRTSMSDSSPESGGGRVIAIITPDGRVVQIASLTINEREALGVMPWTGRVVAVEPRLVIERDTRAASEASR